MNLDRQQWRVIGSVGPSLFEPVVREPSGDQHTHGSAAVEELIRVQGVCKFRFSKGSSDQRVRETHALCAAANHDTELDFILDVPGMKPRLTNKEAVPLVIGKRYQFCRGSTDNELGLSGIPDELSIGVGSIVVTGDGDCAFEVMEEESDGFTARCISDGVDRLLGPQRGFTLVAPDGSQPSIQCRGLNEHDTEILQMLSTNVYSTVMLSFVESVSDVTKAKSLIEKAMVDKRIPRILSKIETPAAVRQAASIYEVSDGVVLGRGDLLLQSGPIEFYAHLEEALAALIDTGHSRQDGEKPVIVGTQLLESLSTSYMPNRSEIMEISRLISRGVDGFLLSFETAIGKKPVATVKLINQLFDRYQEK